MGKLVVRRRPPQSHLKIRCAVGVALAVGAIAPAPAQEEVRNWFDDPYLRLTAEVPDCPTPAGPFVTRQESLAQSHSRLEKGTTAWLAGEAERPKAFAYDKDIAAALAAAFAEQQRFRVSSLWATVQGRVVYIEGCVSAESEVPALEALARSLPNVQQAVAIVRTRPDAPVPYKVMPAAPAHQ